MLPHEPVPGNCRWALVPWVRGFRDRDPRQRGPTRRAGGALRVPPGRRHPAHRRPVRGGQRLTSPPATSRRPSRSWNERLHGGREGRRAARRHRHRQVGDHRLADREGAAAHPGDGAEQDAGRAAGQRAAGAVPAQRRRVLRLLLRLLPARGVRPADGHLHREGLVDQRRTSSGCGTRRRCPCCPGGTSIVVASVSCIYGLGTPQSYLDRSLPVAVGDTIDRDALLRALVDIQYSRNDVSFTRGLVPGARATPWRSSRPTRSSPSGSSSSATRSSGSTTCTR